jgi:glycosyltransferase involved in cell wall biosynthesis
MTAPAPLITIGIACYKSHDTIARAIESALLQDWPNKEIVIVDDASGPETISVIENTIKDRKNVRLIMHPVNKGFAGSLNTIIAEAKGEFLAIFDDDDISAPQRLTRQYERITSYERQTGADLVVCHAARVQLYPNGHQRYEKTMGTDAGIAPHGLDVTDRILFGRLSKGVVGSCANCSRMARIELFMKMKGYDDTMRRAEDTDFNIRLGMAGGHFVGIAEPLVTQTMTLDQGKSLLNERIAELALLEKHKAYLESRGWYELCREWLEARYEYYNNKKIMMFKRLACLFLKHPIKVIFKIFWLAPARETRREYKKWHNASSKEKTA